jgi:hypothetical protein
MIPRAARVFALRWGVNPVDLFGGYASVCVLNVDALAWIAMPTGAVAVTKWCREKMHLGDFLWSIPIVNGLEIMPAASDRAANGAEQEQYGSNH